jgi:hypothetical protein
MDDEARDPDRSEASRAGAGTKPVRWPGAGSELRCAACAKPQVDSQGRRRQRPHRLCERLEALERVHRRGRRGAASWLASTNCRDGALGVDRASSSRLCGRRAQRPAFRRGHRQVEVSTRLIAGMPVRTRNGRAPKPGIGDTSLWPTIRSTSSRSRDWFRSKSVDSISPSPIPRCSWSQPSDCGRRLPLSDDRQSRPRSGPHAVGFGDVLRIRRIDAERRDRAAGMKFFPLVFSLFMFVLTATFTAWCRTSSPSPATSSSPSRWP